MHIGAALAELARTHGARTAIVDDAGRWSFAQFCARAARFGNAMLGLGLFKGDRVALLMPDIREYLEVDYGAMAAGFVRVPLDPRLTRGELVALLRFAGARALVVHSSLAEKAERLTDEVESLETIVGVGPGFGHEYEALLEKSSDRPVPAGDGDDPATINFSGGTTGAPKAIMLRHRNLMTVVQNSSPAYGIEPDSIFVNVRPLWPIAQVIPMAHVFAGATVVLGGRADPDRLTDLIDRCGATRTSLVPTQLVRWLDHLQGGDPRLSRLEAIYVGGARLPAMAFERALDLLGPRIGVLYGMTEAPICCYLPPRELAGDPQRRARLLESVGRPLMGYRLRLAEDTSEVLVQGGNVMAGYWQNEAATRAALRDGWLHTGDIGALDDDGRLAIVGRLNDIIRSGATSIIPKEVEDVIASHPAVDEVAVLGLPDPEWGEAVTAFVVLRSGLSASEHDLIEHCRARLASFKKPRAVLFVPSLPRSHYGKVIRAELLAMAGR